ncbi:MAG: nucleotidyl transferase AbiEii/AbiGii toxin family protein [Elusimicrobiota bacterium]|nr:nucleotidyl transferase AbiEii/AbiGii toxin family protein [Elusimicrobiota bacterium]
MKKFFGRWFGGSCSVPTYSPEELLGTKMRALYQRRKGRDLFDLWYGLKYGNAEPSSIVNAFKAYMKNQGVSVSRKEFSANLDEKMDDRNFRGDTILLLNPAVAYKPEDGYKVIAGELIKLL